jgi:hypothetical protein
MKQYQKSRLLGSGLCLLLSACGGGGGGAAAPALTASSTEVAIAVASGMLELGPSGYREARTRRNPQNEWSAATGTVTKGCVITASKNDDGRPTVGDFDDYVFTDCKQRHLSGAIYSLDRKVRVDMTSLSDPSSPANTVWTYVSTDTETTTKFLFAPITIGGKYAIDRNMSGTLTRTATAQHAADDSQVDTVEIASKSKDVSLLGASDVTLSSRYTCSYQAGIANEPACANIRTTLTGTVYGVPVNAVLTRISAAPVVYEIDLGSSKFTVALTTYSANVTAKRYLLKTAAGEEVVLTGEDTGWMEY